MTLDQFREKTKDMPGNMELYIAERVSDYRYAGVESVYMKEVPFTEWSDGSGERAKDTVIIIDEEYVTQSQCNCKSSEDCDGSCMPIPISNEPKDLLDYHGINYSGKEETKGEEFSKEAMAKVQADIDSVNRGREISMGKLLGYPHLDDIRQLLSEVYQVMTGFSDDDVWSDYDESVRKRVIEMQYKLEKL